MAAQSVSNTLISQLYQSRTILLKQLSARGYNVSDYDEFSVSELQLMTLNQQLDMIVSNEEGHKIYIKYVLGKVSKQRLEEVADELFEDKALLSKETDQLMFVTLDEPNETLQKTCEHLYDHREIYVTVHNIRRLLFDITTHRLVPPHRPLANDEMLDVMKQHRITEPHQFPEISRFDPVALAVGLRPGQLCEITRKSKTALTSKYYRYCV
jgi:DNA-directed RNA polymerase subunit H